YALVNGIVDSLSVDGITYKGLTQNSALIKLDATGTINFVKFLSSDHNPSDYKIVSLSSIEINSKGEIFLGGGFPIGKLFWDGSGISKTENRNGLFIMKMTATNDIEWFTAGYSGTWAEAFIG